MKKSRFNLLVEKNDEYALLFNSFSRGFIQLERQLYDKFKDLALDPEHEVTIELKRGFFLVDHELDELKVLDARNRVSRYKSYRFALLILPTLNCNFSCEYCFEEKRNVSMTPETEEAVLKFLEERLKEIKQLKISWFGGEPLLAKNIIDRLARKIIDLCQKRGVAYHSDMTSNGYLLNQKNIDWLKEIGVEKIQITIDGDRETHDQRRKLKNGRPTFDTIINNLKLAAGHFQLPIRVNIDRKNADKAKNLFPILVENELHDKVWAYYGTVVGLTDACRSYGDSCLDADELTTLMIQLHREALDKKYDFVSFPYPLTSMGGCGAMRPDFFVVDADGYLHKCLNSVGNPKEAIGHITKPIEFTQDLVTWLTWDPLEDQECSQCNLLPLCNGGCLWNKLHGRHSCGYYQGPGYVKEILKLYHNYMSQQPQEPAGIAASNKGSKQEEVP